MPPFPANTSSLEPWTKRSLFDGATAEVATNPRDGVWDAAQVGTEDMVFAQDVVEVLGTHAYIKADSICNNLTGSDSQHARS